LAYERQNDTDRARQDFRNALKQPLKCYASQWPHQTANERLAALTRTIQPPPQPKPPATTDDTSQKNTRTLDRGRPNELPPIPPHPQPPLPEQTNQAPPPDAPDMIIDEGA